MELGLCHRLHNRMRSSNEFKSFITSSYVVDSVFSLGHIRKVNRKAIYRTSVVNRICKCSLAVSTRFVENIPTLTRVLANGQTIRGLAVLDDRLAVVRWPTDQYIEIYDANTFERRQPITVRGMSDDVFGFASCPINNCFYVSDWHNSVIHRIKLTPSGSVDRHEGKIIRRWSVNNNPTGVSVNRLHNVILTYWGLSVVHEFSTHGTLLRLFNLHPDIVNVWQAIHIHSSDQRHVQLIVSHGDCDDPLNQVCTVDPDGQILHSFGDKPGSGHEQLNVPICMAVVSRDRRILVADQKNDRILMFHSSLKDARDLTESIDYKLQGPSAMHLDESRGRLFVGCWNGQLLVFDNVVGHGAKKG